MRAVCVLVLLAAIALLSDAFSRYSSVTRGAVFVGSRTMRASNNNNEFSRPDKVKPPLEADAVGSASDDVKGGQQEEKSREISSEMRDKIRRELQSQGADPNISAGNPILIVAGIVALLVIVGGQGFFY